MCVNVDKTDVAQKLYDAVGNYIIKAMDPITPYICRKVKVGVQKCTRYIFVTDTVEYIQKIKRQFHLSRNNQRFQIQTPSKLEIGICNNANDVKVSSMEFVSTFYDHWSNYRPMSLCT